MKCALITFILLSTFRPAFSQHINTDAIVRFWQVVDLLEKDLPLDDSLWDTYYHAEGNKGYMDKNRGMDQVLEHRKYLEFVFRPSFSDSLQAVEKAGSQPADDILDNLLYIKANEQQLRSYSNEVVSSAYLQQCIDLARRYLPKGLYRPVPTNLTIYIMAMTFDAAVQDSSMYFGIARTYEYDKYRVASLAAHELHHQMRVSRGLKRKVSPADSASFYAVDEINNEGSADLIDKILLLDNPGKVFRGANFVHRVMDSADRTVRALDSSFRLNATAITNFVTSRRFERFMNYSSGHRPGLYMVTIIRRNGLEKQLIEHNDNPFHFFYLYNKAAEKDLSRPPVFSKETISYLHTLEKATL